MQADKLDGFICVAPEVKHRYKQKHLRTAFTQLPGAKDSSSTVSSKASRISVLHDHVCCPVASLLLDTARQEASNALSSCTWIEHLRLQASAWGFQAAQSASRCVSFLPRDCWLC